MSCNEITSPTFELLEHLRLISSSRTRLCQATGIVSQLPSDCSALISRRDSVLLCSAELETCLALALQGEL